MPTFPVLMHTALDSTDCRGLAEFYRQFLGLRYRPGDEPPEDGTADGIDWLVLIDEAGRRVFAFNQVEELARATWPTDDVPKQMHHDFRVSSVAELERQRQRAQTWAPPSSTTGLTTRTSLCMCSPIPLVTHSAFLWPLVSRTRLVPHSPAILVCS